MAQEAIQEAAGQAQEKAQEAAGMAQEKAHEAAGRARGMVHEQIDERSTNAGEQVSGTAEDLRTVGEELRKQGKETPAKFAEQAAERTERVGSYLSEADADKLLSDIEDFGRRRPWAVLAGGLVAGMAAARFLKASSQTRYQSKLGSEQPTREVTPAGAPPARIPVGVDGEAPTPADRVRVPADPVMGR
jgi:hypothetical protein